MISVVYVENSSPFDEKIHEGTGVLRKAQNRPEVLLSVGNLPSVGRGSRPSCCQTNQSTMSVCLSAGRPLRCPAVDVVASCCLRTDHLHVNDDQRLCSTFSWRQVGFMVVDLT